MPCFGIVFCGAAGVGPVTEAVNGESRAGTSYLLWIDGDVRLLSKEGGAFAYIGGYGDEAGSSGAHAQYAAFAEPD